MRTFNIMINEIYKGLYIAWHYKFDMILGLIMTGIIFIGIGFFMGGGHLDQGQLASLLVGYVVFLYAPGVVSSMSSDLLNEAQTGTLEQIFMSPVSVPLLLIGRSFTTLILSTIEVLLFLIPALLILNIHIPMRWQGFVVFVITIAGLFGFGFIIAGASLVFKRVGALAVLLTQALLFLNGTILSIDHFPAWLISIANNLPTTHGIILLRKTLLQSQSLTNLLNDGSLIRLSCNSIYLFLQWIDNFYLVYK